ncbi:MAG: hypothetical protein HND57_05415 [Planctomycetes bacterium]|nr:hypothetical protein [Planctomycetota bacterium]
MMYGPRESKLTRVRAGAILGVGSLAAIACVLPAGLAVSYAQQESVVDSLHNLSLSGPGTVRAASEGQICIFCHTPHKATPIQPLWNRYMPIDAYTVYQSRALDASPDQPTGTSKMCLSCHDGTIALGQVVSRDIPIPMMGGVTTMPIGPSNLGTDLSDDHPISFRYDNALVSKDANLKPPSQLPPEIKLDGNQELQCTTCHDPHNNALGDFLVFSMIDSQLCRSCHQIDSTTVAGHSDCTGCHTSHSSQSGPYLLRRVNQSRTCLRCHDGTHPPAQNILDDMSKINVHDTDREVDPADPEPFMAACTDCHNPHTMKTGTASVPDVHPVFGDIDGVNASGAPVDTASYEFEVCFKCHSDNPATDPWVSRMITQNNTRLEFDPGAISYHPVEAPGRNPDVPSLKPGWTVNSMVYCSDCHGSDTSSKGGGSGPDGVHGSNQEPNLILNYETADYTNESAQAYALCYKCHDRSSILNDESFEEHDKHIRDEDSPCSACHDAHGISSAQGTSTGNSHLINFDRSLVTPDRRYGRLEFIDNGRFAGECYLRCHGENHDPEDYRN